MPQITIDGNVVEFEKGQTIIQAARNAGIEIAHFCWHPAMSVSGNCRICLVEIEKMPKLMIACSTPAGDGMVVHTKSEKTIHAQNAVMEFLLINHPLDCPICDEAGECKLQDYAYKYSVGTSRYDEEKNHKEKRVPLGPNVMFDAERCISCSRCIRYCEEVVKDPQLTFVKRGEKVTITTFPGQELDNPYSMNVIEICPVGALTSREFRFQARVWDMSFTDTICPGCARGCNTTMGVRNNEILRIEPRENMSVNEYWLCDYGRLETIKDLTNENLRISSPKIRVDSSDELIDVGWEEAASAAHSALKKFKPSEMLFIASPFSTLEDNYIFKKTAKEQYDCDNICYIPEIDESFGDDFLKRPDKTPNATGLKLLGVNAYTQNNLEDVRSGKVKAVIVLNDDITRINNSEEIFKNVEMGIHFISCHNKASGNADIIFPVSTYSELHGTFVNFENKVQRIRPALSTLENERIIGEFSMSRIDKFGAHNDRWTHGTKFNSRPAWKCLEFVKHVSGHQFKYDTTEDVFIELANTIKGMEGADYETVGHKGFVVGQLNAVTA